MGVPARIVYAVPVVPRPITMVPRPGTTRATARVLPHAADVSQGVPVARYGILVF